jgi:arylsulfatase A
MHRFPATIAFALPLALLGADAARAAERPNVVLILADDLGINDLGCYGRKDHRTPNLDRLAAQGTRFANAYAAASICSPNRAALMSGKSPARLHLTTFLPGRPDAPSQKVLHPRIAQQLPLEEVTIAEHFRKAGYATACFGKWHLGGKGFQPQDQGFDAHEPGQANTTPSATEGGKGEYELTAKAQDFLRANRDRPFFLYLPHNSPHIPYKAQPGKVESNRDAFEPNYAAVIESLDDSVGRLLATLDELKVADSTLVIFTSDNGGLHVPEGPHERITHNTPFRAGKGYLHEGGIRVPLIARWTGHVPAGRVEATPTIATDWLPTFLEILGEPTPSELDGASFAPALLGKSPGTAAAPPRRLFWHQPHYTNQGGRPSGAVREGKYKLIRHDDDGSVALFDLESDPGESADIAGHEPEVARRLRDALAAWRLDVDAQANTPNPDFDPSLFRALYVDFDPSRYDPLDADARARVLVWRKGMNAAVDRRDRPRRDP